LESAKKQLRKAGKTESELKVMFAELVPLEIHQGAAGMLSHFAALSNCRGSGLNGALPITHTEIGWYCRLMDDQLSPWEVEIILGMDAAFRDENYKLQKTEG